VLIVDDDPDTRDLYAWCMMASGWLVHAVENGAEALIAAPVVEPDVIVMDLHLPVLGGLEAIRQIKRHEATKHVPIVACTAFEARSSEFEAKIAGCDEFVPKPCEPEALRELLEVLVAGRRSEPLHHPLDLENAPTGTPTREIRALVSPSMVPRLIVTVDELRDLPLDPRAAFLVSLVDGRCSVGTIADVAGIAAKDAVGIFVMLVQLRVVDLKDPR
jgi:twitching motility two-component system response regulator PilH